MLEELKKGLGHFQANTYKENESLYHDLNNQQHPHTLFITCSDSRIQPEKLADFKPGDAFVVRNIANTVPEESRADSDLTTISSIEFAVEVLGVKEIIVCGHSNCGGCKAVLSAGEDDDLDASYTTKYLKPLFPVKDRVLEEHAGEDDADLAPSLEQANVVEQLNHLRGYSFIQEKIDQGDLEIEGWHYNIGAGQVLTYNEKENKFEEF